MLTKYVGLLFLGIAVCCCIQCKQSTTSPSFPLEHLQSLPVGTQVSNKKKTGKITNVPVLEHLFTKQARLSIPFPQVDATFSIALQDQLKLLKRRKQASQQQIGNKSIQVSELKKTIETFLYAHLKQPNLLLDSLDAYQIHGKDKKGNVYFTGYFTPVIAVSAKPSANYTYPIYTRPDREKWSGPLPSRVAIDGQGVLEGRGLELAYARRLVDIYFMQLQGSGIIEYPNGRQEYLSFTSTNGHSYRSIEKYIINNEDIPLSDVSMDGIKRFVKQNPELEKPILFTNPSYVFFDRKRERPHGAGHVPLTKDYSIAVDSKYIPLGSCLLAAMPVVDHKGKFSHHEYKIVLAQDTGGAIRGSGHVDVYCGVGKEAQQKAMAFHHYGRLWLLLPKEELIIN